MNKENLIQRILTTKYVKRIENKVKLLGLKYDYDVKDLLIYHMTLTIIVFCISLILFNYNFILTLILTVAYFYLAEYIFLDYRLAKRSRKLDKDAIFFFQILVLNLESGTNLKQAIELTSKNINSDLSMEFRKVINDMKLGESLTEALDDLKTRIPSDTINNIILNLTQSNIYGSNMIESLNNQIEYLNNKILLDIKAQINKMPIKISIISVLIFVPIILLIILSPVFLELINS